MGKAEGCPSRFRTSTNGTVRLGDLIALEDPSRRNTEGGTEASAHGCHHPSWRPSALICPSPPLLTRTLPLRSPSSHGGNRCCPRPRAAATKPSLVFLHLLPLCLCSSVKRGRPHWGVVKNTPSPSPKNSHFALSHRRGELCFPESCSPFV